ncbi:MAG TPA: zinc-dependent metalloprotease [Planctomycetaceae bacterium]|nr:zinc-dependent metalloprotease [Planctomycetaceae bacterium]
MPCAPVRWVRTPSSLALMLMLMLNVTVAWAQAPAAPTTPPPSKFDQATTGAKKAEGLWTVYTKEQQVLVDLKAPMLGQDFMMLTSIARGISSGMVIGGMTWGDDVVWNFRKVGDKMHVIRKNVRFKAKPGSPEATAVKFAYTDSVLYALPIVADSPGGHLVDMTRVFLSDDEQIGKALNAGFVMDRSTVAGVKSFKDNVELQIAAVYSSPSSGPDTVVDSRGMQVIVHYSISKVPNTGYRPRKADDRIGYFLTATKDFTDNSDPQHFVRYITRWDLQKADPNAKMSPPKTPIIFYMEKTIPIHLRPIVRSGIEEWNRAYEKIGFANAIEVRQQRDEDEWDPEDVNYNTFRWITADAGFAMGPSRVNPMTGQILDADIIFDAGFLRSWRVEYENFSAQTVASWLGDDVATPSETLPFLNRTTRSECRLSNGMAHQFGFAAAALMANGVIDKKGELPEEFVQQALKEVVMHEVGHTLGLRHNFKASAWKTLQEIDDPSRPLTEATVASVMDYSPSNIAAVGAKQAAYYTTTIGPYDHWAIEYGYKVITGDENAELAKIASRSGEPGLDYATDEDTRRSDPDPLSNRFDLGKDPVAYAARQIKTTQEMLPKLMDRTVDNGDGYQKLRQAFVAPKFDPTLLNSLASTRWLHWGQKETSRIDYAINDTINQFQNTLLSQLTRESTLARIQDGELRVPANEDAYTLAEHLQLLVDGVFSEVKAPPAGEFNNRNAFINSFRRNLQRNAAKRLISMAVPSTSGFVLGGDVPEDARVLARSHLVKLKDSINATLTKGDLKLDEYSRAHLEDLQARITQALDAKVMTNAAN